ASLIEDHQPTCCQTEPIQITIQLFQSFFKRIALAVAPDFQFHPLGDVPVAQTDVHSSRADSVLPFERTATIYHTMQKGHQYDVWRDFMVMHALEQRLSMLPPECEKSV